MLKLSLLPAFIFTLFMHNGALAKASSTSQLIAQNELSDISDPFADFSEFAESSEEEADVNFFKNGRFLNIGLMVGPSIYTGNMSKAYSNPNSFGLLLTYFFDLRFAAQFTYITGNGSFQATTLDNSSSASVSSSISLYSIDVKYFLNTDDVTKGLADLNPYFIVGFGQVSRSLSSGDQDTTGADASNGFNLGVGIEFPMLRNKMYIGFEATYRLINFPDESQEITINDLPTGIYPSGDIISTMAVMGFNF